MSDMADAIKERLSALPPLTDADPGYFYVILRTATEILERYMDPEDKVSILKVAVATKVGIDEFVKIASEELDNVQRH